jgi:hypothetical protein
MALSSWGTRRSLRWLVRWNSRLDTNTYTAWRTHGGGGGGEAASNSSCR